MPASCTACAITTAYEGVETSTCAPRSWRSIAWRADIPPETGTTGAPIRSAPWWKPWPPVKSPYVFALCTSIPGRTPASVMQRAISSVHASRSARV